MKNFIAKKKSPLPLPLALASVLLLSFQACDKTESSIITPMEPTVSFSATPASVARMLSEVPISIEQVMEVWNGVNASSANGYDEEYTFLDMFASPGRGIGDELTETRSSLDYTEPLCQAISACPAVSSVDLASSGLQIYWPYSENWDKKSMPVITFCPALL